MAEVAVSVLCLTYNNTMEELMTPWVTDIMRRTNAMVIQRAGALAAFAFVKTEDMKKCFKALRDCKYDVIMDRTPCFIDTKYIAEYEKQKAEADKKQEDMEERFLYKLIEDINKSKTELERHIEELERKNEGLNQLYRILKQDSSKAIAERDKRIQELTKEILGLEHRLKEMEEMRMRTYWE